MWPAIEAGLIIPLDDTYQLVNLDVQGLFEDISVDYQFVHDQVQRAAYSLLSEKDKSISHYRVGQLLIQNIPEAEYEQKIFDIVDQLNLGNCNITQQSEKIKLAELNLTAGIKAKTSAAYHSAFNYLNAGIELLDDDDAWQANYDLALLLYTEGLEAAFLNNDFAQMERWIGLVKNNAVDLLDQILAYEVQVQAHIAQNNLLEAIKAALEVLAKLGVVFPEQPEVEHIGQGMGEVSAALQDREIESLANLPEMSDPSLCAAMQIMKTVNAANFLAAPNLFALMILKQVSLSITQGNAAESAYAYANFGVMCSAQNDIEAGYRWGKLALDLVEQLDNSVLKANIWFFAYAFSISWKEPVKDLLDYFREGYQTSLETGNPEFASYFLSIHSLYSYCIGKELTQLDQEMAEGNAIIGRMEQARTLEFPSYSVNR